MTDLRDRIASVLVEHGGGWIDNGKPDTRCRCGYRPSLGEAHFHHAADAVIAALPTAPSDAGERLDCIGRWMKPSLWSALDGRREAILRILKGEIIEPPDW